MGRYRLEHAFLLPSLISLTRVPLAALFVLSIDVPSLALLLLALAGLSDVLDGWLARRSGQATATGAVIDGITDKLFMATVVVCLVVRGPLDPWGAVQLATRELGELPLVLWWALHHDKRRARAEDPKANALGKLCTTVQFVAVLAALFNYDWLDWALGASALLGILAAGRYWMRELA